MKTARIHVEIVKETKKAKLIRGADGRQGWIQARWLADNGTVSAQTYERVCSHQEQRTAEVDAALGMIAEHPERAEIERVADDWAAKAKATADAAEAAARAERAREEAGLWAAVARRDGELVAKLIGDICDSACLDDPREVAIMNYGRPTAEQAGALIEWEGIGDDETLLRDAVRAAWERAWEQSAWANLEAAIIEDGPYTVGEFGRDSLTCTGLVCFADRETAEAYLAMAGYDPTCAFTARVGRVDAE